MDDLISEFIAETSESLAALDGQLDKLAQHPNDPAILTAITKLLHAIKSTCGFLGLPRLEALAQATESAMAWLRHAGAHASPASVSLILEAMAQTRQLVTHLEAEGCEAAGDDRALISRLRSNAVESDVETLLPAPVAPLSYQKLNTEADVTYEQEIHDPLSWILPPLETHTTPLQVQSPQLRTESPARLTELIRLRDELSQFSDRSGWDELKELLQQLSEVIAAKQRRLSAQKTVPVLLMDAATHTFALAQQEIVELVRVGRHSPHMIEVVHRASLLKLRDELVPLVHLRSLLDMPSSDEAKEQYIVVLKYRSQLLGLVVDRLGALAEVTLKPLDFEAGPFALYAGAATLADDKLTFVLDKDKLARQAGVSQSA